MRRARKIALVSPAILIAACGYQYSSTNASNAASAPDGGSIDAAAPEDSALTPTPMFPDATPQPSNLPECTAQRVGELVGGNGGLAWYTLEWPVPNVIENYAPTYAYDNPTYAVAVLDA